MKNGDVVFFKKAKKDSRRKTGEVQFKGHGFGILLGHVPPFAKDPPPNELFKMIGSVGFLTFDDVGEFFGNEVGAECVKKFEDKYYGKLLPGFNEDGTPKINPDGTPVPSKEHLEMVRQRLEALEAARLQKPTGLVDTKGQPLEDPGNERIH